MSIDALAPTTKEEEEEEEYELEEIRIGLV